MNRKDLEAFRAVANYASFTLAAQELGLTQPAISKRVASLEQRLAAPLFDRVGRRVFLTAAGAELQQGCERILAAMVDTERAIANLARAPRGILRLATSHHIGLHRLAPVLRAFNSRFAEVQLDIRFEDSEDAAELVASGDVEIAVVTLDPNGTQRLVARTLWQDPLVFVANSEHPLCRSQSLSLAQLARAPAILPGLKTYTGRIVVDLFARAGLTLTPSLSTNYLETIHMLVGSGLGWSMLPATMCKDLRVLPVPNRAARQLGTLINPTRTRSNAAQALESVLDEFADAL